jgi:hypothetical protein
MRGTIPRLSQYVFMAWCSVKHKDNFTFNFTQFEHCLCHWSFSLAFSKVGSFFYIIVGIMSWNRPLYLLVPSFHFTTQPFVIHSASSFDITQTLKFYSLLWDLRYSTLRRLKSRSYWDVTPCSVAVVHNRFGVPYCLHLQGEMKMEAAWSFETLYPTTTLHGVTTQKTSTW